MLSCDSAALHRWKHSPASALDAVACGVVPLRLSRLDLINLSIARPDTSVAPILSLASGQRDVGRGGTAKRYRTSTWVLVRRVGVAARRVAWRRGGPYSETKKMSAGLRSAAGSCCGSMWYAEAEATHKIPSLVYKVGFPIQDVRLECGSQLHIRLNLRPPSRLPSSDPVLGLLNMVSANLDRY